MELDLRRRRDLSDILSTAFSLYGSYFWTFAVIALAVVVPVNLLVYGVAGEQLWSDYDAGLPLGAAIASYLTPYLLTIPLITAGHVHATMDVADRRTPSAASSLRAALALLLPVAGGVALVALTSALALLLLIVPGVYLWVRWSVTAQAIVAERIGVRAGMRRSAELVKGQWWRVFGIQLAVGLIGGIFVAILVIPLEVGANLADRGQLSLLGTILSNVIGYSFTALNGTLLYFDLRARLEQPEPVAPHETWPSPEPRPESPGGY